jgi:hypothetical protein
MPGQRADSDHYTGMLNGPIRIEELGADGAESERLFSEIP